MKPSQRWKNDKIPSTRTTKIARTRDTIQQLVTNLLVMRRLSVGFELFENVSFAYDKRPTSSAAIKTAYGILIHRLYYPQI